MKTDTVKLVLARWDQVEHGDVVFYDGHLYEIDAGPYEPDSESSDLYQGYKRFEVDDTESSAYFSATDIHVRLDSRVPVVVP